MQRKKKSMKKKKKTEDVSHVSRKMFKNFNIPVMRIMEEEEKENGAKYLQR